MPKFPIAAFIAGLAFTAAASEAAQRSGSDVSVRNDTRHTLNCRATRPGVSRFDTVVLRAGQAWNVSNSSARPWVLYCDPPAAGVRYRLRAGTAYHLVPDSDSVQIVLRAL